MSLESDTAHAGRSAIAAHVARAAAALVAGHKSPIVFK